MSLRSFHVDAAIATELVRVVEPMVIEAALRAERMHMNTLNERRRIVKLELQQAQYEASLRRPRSRDVLAPQ